MDEQADSEIKILIDALKYTSNIIVDLTNKLTIQEEKISILENKLNKIQKMSMENNLKLKTIYYDILNTLLKSQDKYINSSNKKQSNIRGGILDNSNDSDNVSEYVIEKDVCNKNNKSNQNDLDNKKNLQNTETLYKDKEKNKIDKLIGSIVKRKNLLAQITNNNNENNINENNINEKKIKDCYTGLDLTIKTGTVKSEIINTYSNNNVKGINNVNNNTNIGSNEIEQNKIISAQNNDLNKANNILKQIRRRANIRKM